MEKETLGSYPWYNDPDWKSEEELKAEAEKKNIFTENVDSSVEDAYNNIGKALLFPCALNNVFMILALLLLGGGVWLKLHEWCLGESFCGDPAINYIILAVLIFFDIALAIAFFKTFGYRAWQYIGIPLWILGFFFKIPAAGIPGVIMCIIGAICKYRDKNKSEN